MPATYPGNGDANSSAAHIGVIVVVIVDRTLADDESV